MTDSLVCCVQVMNDEAGYVMFRGKQHTMITYDPEKKMWTMRVVNKPSVYATSSTHFQDLLIGLDKNFYFTSDIYSSTRTSRMDNIQ